MSRKEKVAKLLMTMRDMLDKLKEVDDVIIEHGPSISVELRDPKAKVPTKDPTDAGWDLYSTEDITIKGGTRQSIKTGIALEIPKGYVGLIWPRSGLATKKGIDVLAGVIDSGYRGEIIVCLYNTNPSLPLDLTDDTNPSEDLTDVSIKAGDRIAQILFQEIPSFNLDVVNSLSESDRGEKGFGSSGS